jgi:hypothetical protein
MITRTMKRILLLTFALCVCVLASPMKTRARLLHLRVALAGIGMNMASCGNIAPISKVIAPLSKAGVTGAVATKGWSTALREGFDAVKSVFQPVESIIQVNAGSQSPRYIPKGASNAARRQNAGLKQAGGKGQFESKINHYYQVIVAIGLSFQ